MKKLLFLLLSVFTVTASAVQQHEKHWEVIACYEDTSISSSVGISGIGSFTTANVQEATRVVFQTEGDDLRWTDDGTTPTSTLGFKQVLDAAAKDYRGELESMLFIEEGTSMDVFMCLYK